MPGSASTRARIVGDVRLGAGSVVDERTSVRADEGSPIVIGAGADIEDAVTFHALKGTSIHIGARLVADGATVYHGPLVAGDDLRVDADAVVFRARIGNRVTIGEGRSSPARPTTRSRSPTGRSSHRARVTTQAEVDAL